MRTLRAFASLPEGVTGRVNPAAVVGSSGGSASLDRGAAKSVHVVTSVKGLLSLENVEGIPIVPVADFLEWSSSSRQRLRPRCRPEAESRLDRADAVVAG